MLLTKSSQMLRYSYAFTAIGTQWSIDTPVAISPVLKRELQQYIHAYTMRYSRFEPYSTVSQVARQGGSFTFPECDVPLFALYNDLYMRTQGKFSPLVGRTLEDLGYDAAYTLKPRTALRASQPLELLTQEGTVLTFSEPALLDIGAAGKGHLANRLADILKQHGHSEYTIDASGDIIHCGKATQEVVGLEHPFDSTQTIGHVTLQNQALCASAVSRRAWGERQHHIIDATTQKPVTDIVATWVIADEALIADGIATALFLCEPHVLSDAYSFEYVRMYRDGRIEYSTGFKEGIYE